MFSFRCSASAPLQGISIVVPSPINRAMVLPAPNSSVVLPPDRAVVPSAPPGDEAPAGSSMASVIKIKKMEMAYLVMANLASTAMAWAQIGLECPLHPSASWCPHQSTEQWCSLHPTAAWCCPQIGLWCPQHLLETKHQQGAAWPV